MLKKFMAATSATALLAGAASAQLLLEAHTGGTVDPGYEIAEEVDFAALNATVAGDGTVDLEVVTQGTIPPGQNLFLTITATNATWSAGLNGAEFTSGTTGAVVDSGGTAGTSSVRYLITSDVVATASSSTNGADHVAVTLPFNMTGCGDVTFQVTEFQTEAVGTPIEGGTASLTTGATPVVTPLITCVDAYVASVVDDSLAPSSDPSVLSLVSSFANFVDTTAVAPVAHDTPTTARLGVFNLAVDTTVNINLINTLASAGDVLGFDANVNFADATDVATVAGTPTTGAFFTAPATAPVGNSVALAGTTTAGLAAEVGDLLVTISGANPVPAQTVTVSGGTIDLDTTDNLLATDAFVAQDAEDLKLEGQIFGPFDWVSDSTKLVNTIFRVTGLSTTEDVPAQIVVENSRNGAAFNGVYPTTILGSSVQGSEIRWNSAALEAVAGQFGTADISLIFSTNNDLDVDRLLAGPSTAVVVPFGDGANQDGSGTAGALTSPGTGVNDDSGVF